MGFPQALQVSRSSVEWIPANEAERQVPLRAVVCLLVSRETLPADAAKGGAFTPREACRRSNPDFLAAQDCFPAISRIELDELPRTYAVERGQLWNSVEVVLASQRHEPPGPGVFIIRQRPNDEPTSFG